MGKRDETLEFFLDLNQELAAKEAKGDTISGPGLPPSIKNAAPYITGDCIQA